MFLRKKNLDLAGLKFGYHALQRHFLRYFSENVHVFSIPSWRFLLSLFQTNAGYSRKGISTLSWICYLCSPSNHSKLHNKCIWEKNVLSLQMMKSWTKPWLINKMSTFSRCVFLHNHFFFLHNHFFRNVRSILLFIFISKKLSRSIILSQNEKSYFQHATIK